MGLFSRKYKNYDDDDDYEIDENEMEEEEEGDGADIAFGGANMELKVIKPTGFEQILSVADYLLEGRTVLLNIEGIDKQLCRRMIDFISGVAYALGSTIKKATNESYFIAPRNVDVSGEIFDKHGDDTFSNI